MARGSVNIGGKNYDAEILGVFGLETEFNSDYSVITQTKTNNDTLVTTFNEDGTITEVFTQSGVDITKTITFNEDGSISEVIS